MHVETIGWCGCVADYLWLLRRSHQVLHHPTRGKKSNFETISELGFGIRQISNSWAIPDLSLHPNTRVTPIILNIKTVLYSVSLYICCCLICRLRRPWSQLSLCAFPRYSTLTSTTAGEMLLLIDSALPQYIVNLRPGNLWRRKLQSQMFQRSSKFTRYSSSWSLFIHIRTL